MRLPRYRLRTLLIAVAVAALGMGTIVGLGDGANPTSARPLTTGS